MLPGQSIRMPDHTLPELNAQERPELHKSPLVFQQYGPQAVFVLLDPHSNGKKVSDN